MYIILVRSIFFVSEYIILHASSSEFSGWEDGTFDASIDVKGHLLSIDSWRAGNGCDQSETIKGSLIFYEFSKLLIIVSCATAGVINVDEGNDLKKDR